jgi:hypothetical protein
MANFQYRSGLGNVGSYQVSGRPFVSSSIVVPAESGTPVAISFPSVTRTINIRNDGAATIRCGFSANGVSGSATNYFTLTQNASFEQEFKVIGLYLISDSAATSTATVIAGLTGIPKESLIGNWSGSAGIG